MKKIVCFGLMLVLLLGCACADGTGTELWAHEAGWMNFTRALTQEGLEDLWDEAAKTFGASVGLAGLGREQLKKMMLQGHQLENDVEILSIEGNLFTAKKADGTKLFSQEYSPVETIRNKNILGGETVHVFKAKKKKAGEYKYLLLTEPQKAEGEGGSYITFNLVCTGKDDYKSLFSKKNKSTPVAVCAMIEKDTPKEGLALAIQKLFANPVVVK